VNVTIQERKFSFSSEYDIFATGSSYYARKKIFSFTDKLQLQSEDGRILARIAGSISPLRHRHAFNLADGRSYRFWCEKLWKRVYACEGHGDLFRLYEHRGLRYSIFQGDRQIAAVVKNRLVFGNGNKYEIRMDAGADLILVVCLVMTVNSSEEDNHNQGLTIDFGNLGPEDRRFDETWEPR
jgi:uncharacterized protein YxjI